MQQLRSQTILLEIETVDNWLHAKTLEGQKGWTHTNFVKPIDSTPCLVTGANLNVREMPGEVYRSLARLRKGEIVLKLGQQGDWFHVLYEGQIAGYCYKDYLQPLNDPAVYKPPMQAIRNESVGQPIRVQVSGDGILERTLVFTVLDDQIVLHGSTKILILHSNKDIFASDRTQYTSEDIIKRQRLESSSAIVNSGLPEELGITYIGADVLTMLGHRVDQNWQYDLTLPAEEGIEFAFLVQKGPSRGTVILVQP
ncbi:SH3 domain-containing protein [bacterium]|nr:SH3 domain-containing protein [bacterium]